MDFGRRIVARTFAGPSGGAIHAEPPDRHTAAFLRRLLVAVPSPAWIGGAMLLLGAALYLLARPAGINGKLIGAAPSFIHVVAMVLLLAATLRPARRGELALCVAWVGVNWSFEIGQHRALAYSLATALDTSCGGWEVCGRSARFFLRGTFDPLDLAAAALGGLAAWLALSFTSRPRESRA